MEQHYQFLRTILILITVGIYILILQNAGLVPQIRPMEVQSTGEGLLIRGEVDIPNTVFIKGVVDANLESINGYNKFYKDPRTGEFYVIPVTDPYE
ncbi:MAG: hypothetical protein KKD74_04840 [Bacteroidetes bacterium]|nr:hypothetical protein [Bacteroidales bacterium]MBU1009445.1 hypothetical protein [Bacteroidota bacterium]